MIKMNNEGRATGFPKTQSLKNIKKNNKVCIIGFAPSWNLAPFKDIEGVDFWGINELYIYLNQIQVPINKFSAWFEIHDIKNSPSKQAPRHQNFLKTLEIPLITQQYWPEYPTSIEYPRKEIKKMTNRNFILDENHSGFSDYSNQISWMIALAIYLKYKEIMVYGVDMAQTSEYAFQRASCQFFIGLAAGKGIKLKIPKSCELLKAGCDYGFQSDNSGRFDAKKRIEGHNQALQQLRIKQAEIKYYQHRLDEELIKKLAVLDAQIDEAENEIRRIEAGNLANNSVLDFLKSMPTNPQEAYGKRDSIVKQTQTLFDTNVNNIKAIKSRVIELKKKKDNVLKDTAINKTLLDDEYDINKGGAHELKGHIKAHEHSLNNNLV
jgi:hypothetical protein